MGMLTHDLQEVNLSSIPCAVHKLTHTSDSLTTFSSLTVEYCQLAFQNWVAYDLYGHKNKRNTGHIQCPLIRCQSSFQDLESCLNHLAKCAWLSNAWYWCPFCDRPERFTALNYSPAVALEPGQSREDQKNSPPSSHQLFKPKSGTARFLKTLGGKLGFLPRATISRSITQTPINNSVGDQSQSDRFLTPANSTVANKDTVVIEENTPRQEYVGASVTKVTGLEQSIKHSVPELDGSPKLWELSSDQDNNMWFRLPAERAGQPQELIGSAPPCFNTGYQWPLPERSSSEYDTYTGPTLHSTRPSMSFDSPPSYTSMSPQHGALPASSLQKGAELETSPNRWSVQTLANSTGLEAAPDNSISHLPHQPHQQGIYEPPRVDSSSSTGRYETSLRDGIRDIHSRNSSHLIQMAHSPFVQPQSTTSSGDYENHYTMNPNHHGTLLGNIPVDPVRLTSFFRNYSFVTRDDNDMGSSQDGPTVDNRRQTIHFPPREPNASSNIQCAQNQNNLESSSLPRSVSSQEAVAPITSPTESTVSSSRISYRSSCASTATQPTSAEATPIAPRPQSNRLISVETRLERHMERPQCPHCGAVFSGTYQDQKSNCKRHIRWQHGPQEKPKCLTCGKEYSRPDNLKKHHCRNQQDEQPLRRSNACRIRSARPGCDDPRESA